MAKKNLSKKPINLLVGKGFKEPCKGGAFNKGVIIDAITNTKYLAQYWLNGKALGAIIVSLDDMSRWTFFDMDLVTESKKEAEE